MAGDWPSKFHLPNWTLMIRSLFVSSLFSTPVEHSKHFRYIRLVVDYAAIDFNPRVGLKRHLLRTNDHLSAYAGSFQKARCGRGSLQAERLFPIPDAGHVHCGADLLGGVRSWSLVGNRTVANFVVDCGEVFSR